MKTFKADGCLSDSAGHEGFVPFGASLQITCDVGFQLNGPGKITCLKNGSFDRIFPKCIGELTFFERVLFLDDFYQ